MFYKTQTSASSIKELQSKSPAGESSISFEQRKFIRAKDAADYLSISLSHFHALVRQEKIPSGKLITGAVRVWKVSELNEAANNMWEAAQ